MLHSPTPLKGKEHDKTDQYLITSFHHFMISYYMLHCYIVAFFRLSDFNGNYS